MTTTKHLGERMSWLEMVKEFPNMWVCVSDYKNTDTEEFTGVIESVCKTIKEKDMESVRLINAGKQIYWNYTGDVDL